MATGSAQNCLIDARDVHMSFAGAEGPVQVLNGVSIALNSGETLALTGESGSGKSTLLHLLGALDEADSGTIEINGIALNGLGDKGRAAVRRDHIGLVFQQFNLIPSLNVAANISFQARLAGRDDADWISTLTEQLGLTDLQDRYPEQLSGGQQQRVAIGRALAGRPKVLLADEPTGNLDETTSDQVLNIMLDLVAASGAALLMVTHSIAIAERLSRRVHLAAGRVS
jgi:putative ABC transport system ATP-binding protein